MMWNSTVFILNRAHSNLSPFFLCLNDRVCRMCGWMWKNKRLRKVTESSLRCALITICRTTGRSISREKQTATRALTGKHTPHISPSIRPTERQMNLSAVQVGECLALCRGSAAVTSAAVHQPRRGREAGEGSDGVLEEASMCWTGGCQVHVFIGAVGWSER